MISEVGVAVGVACQLTLMMTSSCLMCECSVEISSQIALCCPASFWERLWGGEGGRRGGRGEGREGGEWGGEGGEWGGRKK